MAVTVLETLSREDLERWREVCVLHDTVTAAGVSVVLGNEEMFNQIKRVFHDYYALTAELLERYGIEGEEAEQSKINPATGNIYTGAEE